MRRAKFGSLYIYFVQYTNFLNFGKLLLNFVELINQRMKSRRVKNGWTD